MYKKRQWCETCQDFTLQAWYGGVGNEALRQAYFQCEKCGSVFYLNRKTRKWNAEVPWDLQEELQDEIERVH